MLTFIVGVAACAIFPPLILGIIGFWLLGIVGGIIGLIIGVALFS